MKQNKQTIRLNESHLKQVIKESIKEVLKESVYELPDNFKYPDNVNGAGMFSYEHFAMWACKQIQMIMDEVANVVEYLKTEDDDSSYYKYLIQQIWNLYGDLRMTKESAAWIGQHGRTNGTFDENGWDDFNKHFDGSLPH